MKPLPRGGTCICYINKGENIMNLQHTEKNRAAARLGVALVCAVLAAGLLAGCTGTGSSSSSQANTSSSVSAAEESSSAAEESSSAALESGSSSAADSANA